MEKDYLFCPVCERKTKSCYSKKYKGKSELFYKKDLYQCLACKIIFTHPLPHPPALCTLPKIYAQPTFLHFEEYGYNLPLSIHL